jgi:hypothetical protein
VKSIEGRKGKTMAKYKVISLHDRNNDGEVDDEVLRGTYDTEAEANAKARALRAQGYAMIDVLKGTQLLRTFGG